MESGDEEEIIEVMTEETIEDVKHFGQERCGRASSTDSGKIGEMTQFVARGRISDRVNEQIAEVDVRERNVEVVTGSGAES